MSSLSGSALEHLVPFVEILALAVAAIAALVVGFWKGFRWLDTQITDRFAALISEWTEANDRRHDEHARAISDLRERDSERASAIKRTHERIDVLMERIPPLS
jgi:DNA-binding GntR family transcriptional regulator